MVAVADPAAQWAQWPRVAASRAAEPVAAARPGFDPTTIVDDFDPL